MNRCSFVSKVCQPKCHIWHIPLPLPLPPTQPHPSRTPSPSSLAWFPHAGFPILRPSLPPVHPQPKENAGRNCLCFSLTPLHPGIRPFVFTRRGKCSWSSLHRTSLSFSDQSDANVRHKLPSGGSPNENSSPLVFHPSSMSMEDDEVRIVGHPPSQTSCRGFANRS